MRLSASEFPGHLATNTSTLHYMVGREPFLVQDSCDLVLENARSVGELEVHRFEIATDADWGDPIGAVRSGSLFSARKLVEVHLLRAPGSRDKKAPEHLKQSFSDVGEECLVVFRCGKWDRSHARAPWFKLIDRLGTIVLCEPLQGRQERTWVEQRAKTLGVKMTGSALEVLCAQSEGNPAAALQELQKLSILFSGRGESVTQEALAILDARRATVFQVVDSAIEGDARRMQDNWQAMRRDGSQGDSIGTLAVLAAVLRQAHQHARASRPPNLWGTRKRSIPALVERHTVRGIERLIREASLVDAVQKGAIRGDPWEATERLLLDVASDRQSRLESEFNWARIEF